MLFRATAPAASFGIGVPLNQKQIKAIGHEVSDFLRGRRGPEDSAPQSIAQEGVTHFSFDDIFYFGLGGDPIRNTTRHFFQEVLVGKIHDARNERNRCWAAEANILE